jgi:hypothetical protein
MGPKELQLGNRKMVTHLGETKIHIGGSDLLGFGLWHCLDELGGSG